MNTTRTSTRLLTRIGVATMLATISGSAMGAGTFTNPASIKPADGTRISGDASPVVLSAAQRASVSSAFGWYGRDADLMDGAIVPSVVFTETIGLKERQDQLNVQVKSREDMLQEVIRDLYTERQQIGGASGVQRTVAVDGTIGQGASVDWALVQERVDARLEEARHRLAPSLVERFDDIDMHTVSLPIGVTAETMAEILMRTGDYEFVSIDWLCYPANTVPNDPLINNQWYHTDNRIATYLAWDTTTGGGEIIAVCDTGVDQNHPDLQSALLPGYNAVTNLDQVDGGFVDDNLNGHGTLVAGCSSAPGNNGTGVSGIGWNYGIIPCKVSNNSDGTASLSNILEGARWGSDNGAYVANCSYGGAEDPATLGTGGHIRNEGHLLTFSAGNFGLADQVNDWDTVTIVGASTQADNWATWSHTGIGIDCIAPGASIYSTTRTGGYGFTTGTSFSAPITAGALALVHSANPSLSADEVEYTLLNACDDKETPGEDNRTGWGRINVAQAVNDAIFGPSVVSLPFNDDFSNVDLIQWRDITGDVSVSSAATNEPSGDDSLNLSGTAQTNTVFIRASGFAGDTGIIRFATQHKGTGAGEDLTVEFWSGITSSWQALTTIPSDGVDQDEFTMHRLEFPVFGISDEFRLRFTTNGDSASDDWYIDDVEVAYFDGNSIPWNDDFEDGVSLFLDWSTFTGVVTDEASATGTMSARLDSSDSMETQDIDNSTGVPPIYLRFSTQHVGTEAGEGLVLEYQDLFLNWVEITTIESDGVDQNGFEFHQMEFPVFGFHEFLRLRFTSLGNESNDHWYVDDVELSTEFVDEPADCPADFTGDGALDFFDLSAFLTALSNEDPSADFSGDGSYDFFDVSAFLSAFSMGCP